MASLPFRGLTCISSLQATYIRNTVIQALRSTSNISVHDLPQNFVYAHPTISALTSFLSRLLSGGAAVSDAAAAREAEKVLQELVRRPPRYVAT